MAGGLSAAATERIEGVGQERLVAEEGLQERGELPVEVEDLRAEGTEVAGQGLASGSVSVYRYQGVGEKNLPRAKKTE